MLLITNLKEYTLKKVRMYIKKLKLSRNKYFNRGIVFLLYLFSTYVAAQLEKLCRDAVPFLKIDGITFDPASRWWGNTAKVIKYTT
jgi:hypothetical protein